MKRSSWISGRTLLLAGLLVLGGIGALVTTEAGAGTERVLPNASGDLGVPGVSEKALRRWEVATLGPEHAAEHAMMRAEVRKGGKVKPVTSGPRGGFRTYAAAAVDPAVGGQWNVATGGQPFSIPVFGINAAMLPTGKVLWYAYPNHPDAPPGPKDEAWAWLWDPSLGYTASAFKRVDPPIDPATGKPVNIWCSGTSFLADGRVLVTGGNLRYIDSTHTAFSGLNKVYTFDPFTETWTQEQNMAHGRWYPSQLLMPDGRTVIIQGLDETGTGARNTDVEIFDPSKPSSSRITKQGTLTGNFVGDYYPHMFWMPAGYGLVTGPYTNDSWKFANPGTGTFSPTDIANLPDRSRVWGNAVMVPESSTGGSTKVLMIGGSDTGADYENAPATKTTVQWDGSSWSNQSDQNIGRSHENTVLLPDGSMVTVGGGVGSNSSTGKRLWSANPDQMQVELWNPSTKTWSLGAAQTENRAYHSTAVLLPDGRVVSAGDDYNPSYSTDTAEIYSPPYLFKGARPSITSAPTSIAFNSAFNVDTPNTDVTKAVLIAPGAATHAVDANQRYVSLSVAQRSGGVTLTAPANGNIAPSGYYMLFLVNSNGVPSIAKWVKLSTTAPGNQPPVAQASGTPTSGTVPFTVNFSSAGSSDPENGTLTYAWDLDGDTQFDDSTAANPQNVAYSVAGSYAVKLRVTDPANNQTVSNTVTITANASGGGGTTVEKAQGKPATASSTEGAAWAVAASANDGNTATRWSSNFTNNQWWQVDLGSATAVSSVNVDFCTWAWPATYTVSTSLDGTSWTVVANETLTSGGSKIKTSTFTQTTARYVRITGLTRGTNFGTSINEAKVYGPSGGGGGNLPPTAQASGTPLSGTVPFTVNFSSAGSSDPENGTLTYAWDLDGDTQFDDSTAANPQNVSYSVAGSYAVKLRVTDPANNQTVSNTVTITANAAGNAPPVAQASGTPTSGTVPFTVNFSSAGSSDPENGTLTYAWDLDGDTQFDDSTAANPQNVSYSVAGSYAVKLRVTDPANNQTVSNTVTITANASGGGGTTVEKAQGKPATASSTEGAAWAVAASANDGNTATRWSSNFTNNQWWQVDLGSATAVSSVNVDFCTWAWPATYTVSTSLDGTSWTVVANETLTSGGSKIKTSTFTQTTARYVRITGLTRGTNFGTSINEAKVYGPSGGGGGNLPPTAQASGTPLSGTVPFTVNFSSAGSSDPENGTLTYAWDLDGDTQFDDSTAANPQNVSYSVAGSYAVKLRVTDPANNQTVSNTVTITANAAGNAPPVAQASGTPTSGTVPFTVNFSSAGSSDPENGTLTYAWDLDGDTQFDDSTAANPQNVSYSVAGSYAVKLRVTDPANNQTVSNTVTITANASGGGGTTVEKAQGKPATASSTEGAAWAVAASANDGNTATRWSSNFTNNQWWQVDLGSATAVSSVNVDFCTWAWPATYTVSTSLDGTSWTVVANETLTSGGSKIKTSTFTQTTARYVRITGLTRGTNFGTSINEAKVYGPSGGGGGNLPPTAQASGTPLSGTVPFTVNFSSAGSSDPENGTLTYAWDLDGDTQFDDSTAANPQNVSYSVAGSYAVKLRVTDPANNQTVSNTVTITANAAGGGGGGGGTGTLSFAAPTAITTGAETHSVIAVDVDGDGDSDLVAAVAQANTVAVSLNNGSGSFGAPTFNSTGTGVYPKHAAAGDVNGDGKVDLVSANQNSASITVFRGVGNGTFLAGVVYPTCSAPHQAAFGDLNNDGKQDVAVACYGGAGNVMSVLLNSGDANGTLNAKTDYTTAAGGRSLVLRDFDGDGDLDVAEACLDAGQVVVVKNNSNGTFGAPTTYAGGSPHNIVSTDVNGDGKLDLIVTSEAGSVGILLGNGDATFAAAVWYTTGPVPKATAFGDLNGDGKLDLAVANTHGNYPSGSTPTTLTLLTGSGTGTFSAGATLPAVLTPFSVAIADFNGDGKLDLATANWHSGDVKVFLHT